MNVQGELLALWQLGVAVFIGFGAGVGLTWLVKIAVDQWYGPRPGGGCAA